MRGDTGPAPCSRPARPRMATKRFPINPPHPERTCWGCDRYCAADQLICGNGSERTQHPVEFFGPDWHDWVPPSGETATDTTPANETPAA